MAVLCASWSMLLMVTVVPVCFSNAAAMAASAARVLALERSEISVSVLALFCAMAGKLRPPTAAQANAAPLIWTIWRRVGRWRRVMVSPRVAGIALWRRRIGRAKLTL